MSDVDALLSDRGKRYNLSGSYADHASLTQDLKERIRKHPGWEKLTPAMKETIDMSFHKFARVVNGDPTYPDNWDDVEGYVRLVSRDLKRDTQA